MRELPFDVGPPEDAGAATVDRFHFQHCCAAARLLAALASDTPCDLVCEWHEDYLVIMDGKLEAVSVKHREDHLPAWSVASLVGIGNLGHLFETFCRGGGIECCFESNRAHTVDDLWANNGRRRDEARSDLAERLDADRVEVDAFIDQLRISSPPVPPRYHIEAAYAGQYAAVALDRLGLELDPTAALRLACQLVAAASRERVLQEAWIAFLVAPPQERGHVLAEQRLAARRVDSAALAAALADAESNGVPRLSVRTAEPPAETTMTKKLERGGLGPSVVETARRRRRLWYSHVAALRDIGERESELASLREWVQDQANAAEAVAMQTEPYGQAMYTELIGRLRADAVPSGTRHEDSDPALLSGAAFELTDECSVWWSKPFDAAETDGVG